MTKFEFIQQAALAILRSGYYTNILEVGVSANFVANDLWTVEEAKVKAEEKEQSQSSVNEKYAADNLLMLYAALDAYDEKERKQKEEESRRLGNNYTFSLVGYRKRMVNVCCRHGIKNMGDLLNVGHDRFLKLNGVGKGLFDAVDASIKALYNIEQW